MVTDWAAIPVQAWNDDEFSFGDNEQDPSERWALKMFLDDNEMTFYQQASSLISKAVAVLVWYCSQANGLASLLCIDVVHGACFGSEMSWPEISNIALDFFVPSEMDSNRWERLLQVYQEETCKIARLPVYANDTRYQRCFLKTLHLSLLACSNQQASSKNEEVSSQVGQMATTMFQRLVVQAQSPLLSPSISRICIDILDGKITCAGELEKKVRGLQPNLARSCLGAYTLCHHPGAKKHVSAL